MQVEGTFGPAYQTVGWGPACHSRGGVFGHHVEPRLPFTHFYGQSYQDALVPCRLAGFKIVPVRVFYFDQVPRGGLICESPDLRETGKPTSKKCCALAIAAKPNWRPLLRAGGQAARSEYVLACRLSANVRLERYKSGASGSGLRENIVKRDGKGITDGCN